ncbi:MAG: MarR family transcriptional regulator [Lachnospiraceae bacterium]|nr:MarR family transcriptional regulator [Lachnospiraceae bacterium]
MNKKRDENPYSPGALTYQMIMTNQMHRRMLEKKLEGTGIHRAQHRLLMTLACNRFRSQVELARRLEVSPATIAVSLKTLEREGMITKKAGAEDTRANFVELTEKGEKIVEESREFFDQLDERMYRGFSEEERRELCGFLKRVYENMNDMS